MDDRDGGIADAAQDHALCRPHGEGARALDLARRRARVRGRPLRGRAARAAAFQGEHVTDFQQLVDLASARLGGMAIATNDDFFAEKENLVRDEAPIWIGDKYTDRGKWMDGWESR